MRVLSLPVPPDVYRPIVRTADQAASHWKSIDVGRARWVARWRAPLITQLDHDWRVLVLDPVRRSASPGQALALIEQSISLHRAAWETLLYRLYAQVGQDFADRTARGLKEQWVAEVKATPNVLASLIGGGMSDRWVATVGAWLAENAGSRIRKIEQSTLASVRRLLTTAAATGESIDTVAAKLVKIGPEITASRAVLIARTEIIAASNLGARAGALDTGLDLEHFWLATPGALTRPAHASANGQTQPIDQPFDVDGERLLFPGDSSLGASIRNLANCRCTVAFKPRL